MRSKSRIKNKESRIKNIFLVISVMLFAIFSLFIVFWWARGWDGKEPLNIVVSVDRAIWILAVRPQEQRVVQISVPQTMLVPFGEGAWQAQALWRASELAHDKTILLSAGWRLLDVPVDEILRIDRWDLQTSSYRSVFSIPEWWSVRPDPVKLSGADYLRLVYFLRHLHQGQIDRVDLTSVAVAHESASSTGLLELPVLRISPQIAEWFDISQLRQEDVAVGIQNISHVPGAAAAIARQFEHVGMRVVSVGTDDSGSQAGITVRSVEQLKLLTVRKLQRWMPELPIVVDSTLDPRLDVVVRR